MMREGSRRTYVLLLALLDACAVLTAMGLAWLGRFDVNHWLAVNGFWTPFVPAWNPQTWPYTTAALVTVPMCWLVFRQWSMYAEPTESAGEWFRVGAASFTAAVLLGAFGFYTKLLDDQNQFLFSRGYAAIFFATCWPAVCLFRVFFRVAVRHLARRGLGRGKVLFVGRSVLAEELAQALVARGMTEIVGTLSVAEAKESGEGDARETGSRLVCLGAVEDLPSVVERMGVNEVIAVLPNAAPETWRRLAEQCWRLNVSFRFVPSAGDAFFEHLSLGLVGDIPVLGVRGSRIEGVNYIFKRSFDLAVSAALLTLLSPVYLFVALGILFSDGRPLLYFQERIGRRKRPFRMWKFRSMRRGADKQAGDHAAYLKKYIAGEAAGKADSRGGTVYKLTEDSRVTRFGRFIRRFSLDELPQLWNVFIGEMSLIGPRPPLPYEVEEYRPLHFRRFEAPPGISGLWQVSGRNSLTFEEMIRLDLYYLENWTLELDLRILFKTIQVVLFQRAW